MPYVGQTRARELIATLRELGFGECTQPREYPPRRTPWFLDNAAFSAWRAGRPFDGPRFVAAMHRAASEGSGPDFVVCPDRVAHPDSLTFSREWLSQCREHLRGTPVYLAVQDGMEIERATLADFDGVFVGGTLPWKISTGSEWVQLAHRHGLPCYVGRVGTAKRVRWARRIGCDSIDSCLPLWSADKLRGFVNALHPRQLDFFEATA